MPASVNAAARHSQVTKPIPFECVSNALNVNLKFTYAVLR